MAASATEYGIQAGSFGLQVAEWPVSAYHYRPPTTSIVQRRNEQGSTNSHKSGRSLIHCCWTASVEQRGAEASYQEVCDAACTALCHAAGVATPATQRKQCCSSLVASARESCNQFGDELSANGGKQVCETRETCWFTCPVSNATPTDYYRIGSIGFVTICYYHYHTTITTTTTTTIAAAAAVVICYSVCVENAL